MHDGAAADTGNIKATDNRRTNPRDLELVRALEANGLTHLAAAVAHRLQAMSDPPIEPRPGPG
jgi:hypothetical protein